MKRSLPSWFSFVTHVIDAGGYAGIVALMALNSACIPCPPRSSCRFPATWCTWGASIFLVATAGAVGCNIGSAVAYWIGAKGGRPLVERYGKWVLMSHHDLDRMTGSSSVRVDYGSGGADAAGGADVYCVSGGDCARCRGCGFTSTRLWVRGRGALPGLGGHEAGRERGIQTRACTRRSIASTWWWRSRCWRALMWFVWSHLSAGRQAEAA